MPNPTRTPDPKVNRKPWSKGQKHHRRGDGRGASSSTKPDQTGVVFGLHAAEFALKNDHRSILGVLATENAERKLNSALSKRQIEVKRVSPRDLDKRLGADTVHQGVLLEVEPLQAPDLDELIAQSKAKRLPILILDQVTDPHNVGAALRSCAVFGAGGLIMTHRHSPPLGGTLAKSASGAMDLMPICLVQNLSKAITELQSQSFKVLGLDGGSEHRLLDEAITAVRSEKADLALVLGAEGKGLRELTRQSCDELCRIGGDGPIASLNVSNAAAVALHLAAMQRRQ